MGVDQRLEEVHEVEGVGLEVLVELVEVADVDVDPLVEPFGPDLSRARSAWWGDTVTASMETSARRAKSHAGPQMPHPASRARSPSASSATSAMCPRSWS
jgi:hypothetical protein